MMRKEVLEAEFSKEKEKAKDLERAIAKKMLKNKVIFVLETVTCVKLFLNVKLSIYKNQHVYKCSFIFF